MTLKGGMRESLFSDVRSRRLASSDEIRYSNQRRLEFKSDSQDRAAEGVEGEGYGRGVLLGSFPSDYGSGGAYHAPLAWSGAEPGRKRCLVHFEAKKAT